MSNKKPVKNKKKFYSNPFFILFFLLALIALIYRNSLFGEFLLYDDDISVLDNQIIRSLSFSTLSKFFLQTNLHMYAPITAISYAIDYKINGFDPFYYRLTGVVLHSINVLLVFFISVY